MFLFSACNFEAELPCLESAADIFNQYDFVEQNLDIDFYALTILYLAFNVLACIILWLRVRKCWKIKINEIILSKASWVDKKIFFSLSNNIFNHFLFTLASSVCLPTANMQFPDSKSGALSVATRIECVRIKSKSPMNNYNELKLWERIGHIA